VSDDFPRDAHDDMVANRCYGRITIHYEGGAVVMVKKEVTIKSPQVNNNKGGRLRHEKL